MYDKLSLLLLWLLPSVLTMFAQTSLLDCWVSPTQVTDPVKRDQLKSNLTTLLAKHLEGLKLLSELDVDEGLLMVYSGPRSSTITLRAHKEGLVTVNLDYRMNNGETSLLGYAWAKCALWLGGVFLNNTLGRVEAREVWGIRNLEQGLREAVSAIRSHAIFLPIKRGLIYPRYFVIEDKRLLEYDIDNLVFEAQSPYQKIEIVHSKKLGNMLVLDNLQNLSEADLIYTETLMQRGKEHFKDKEIVILGGGDGALLYELLKEKPKFVWMLELDDVVMKACSKHMRSVCGDVLDKMKTENYEIIVGDCFETLSKMSEQGRKFDYIFGDLTDIPISTNANGDEWDFIRHVITTSMKLLKPTGKYMTHGNGVGFAESLKMFESVITNLSIPVKFTKDQAYVPSFYHEWVFYQIMHK